MSTKTSIVLSDEDNDKFMRWQVEVKCFFMLGKKLKIYVARIANTFNADLVIISLPLLRYIHSHDVNTIKSQNAISSDLFRFSMSVSSMKGTNKGLIVDWSQIQCNSDSVFSLRII